MIDKVRDYVDAVARELKSGVATEHSYRPCLKALLEAFLPGVVVVNEPSRIDCGAPDFLVRENGPARRPVGYVETKDIGDGDLDEYVDDSIVWIIDDLVALFAASDVAAIMENYGAAVAGRPPYQAVDRDPLLHFYEDFLAA